MLARITHSQSTAGPPGPESPYHADPDRIMTA